MSIPKYYVTLKTDAPSSAEKELSEYIYNKSGVVLQDSASISQQAKEAGDTPSDNKKMFVAQLPNDIYEGVQASPYVETVSPMLFF